jgi:hypothetical protein
MPKEIRTIFIFSVVLILICFLSIILFTLPTFHKSLNLTSTSNIGDSIGGITAPIIGIVTSILLYITLSKQVESNIDQRLKSESDIIFLLINQLDNEVATFYTKFTQAKQEFKYTGVEGLNHFTREFRYEYDKRSFDFTFKAFYEANQILLILKSFKLIERRIELAALSNDLKMVFEQKLEIYFQCKLKEQLLNIIAAIDEHPHLKDEITEEIQDFMKLKSKEELPIT